MSIQSKSILTICLSCILLSTNALGLIVPERKTNEEYCNKIDNHTLGDLSKYTSPFEDEMKTSTGVYVLEQGTEAMLTRAWLSDKAEETIDVQYFIFSNDNIGIIAADYLVKAAERGVKVRLLVDDFMVEASAEELIALSSHENLEIKIYNPVSNVGKNLFKKTYQVLTNFHGVNQRMHNKTFTVDGKVSITGGRNVADEYFGYDHEYNFRDRDVLLLGGKVDDVQLSFDEFWNSELSLSIDDIVKSKNPIKADYTDLHEYACNPENFVPSVRDMIHNLPDIFEEIKNSGELQFIKDVEYISDKPGKNASNEFLGGGGISTTRLIEIAKTANHSVVIQTPYLITTDLGKSVFKELVDKGVSVKILTNSLSSNDNLEAFSGYQRDRNKLLDTGVEVFEFKPDAKIRKKVMSEVMHNQLNKAPIFGLHAKTMVIDGETTVIGTFNVDPRSANLNTESITVIPSKEIASRVEAGMTEEMKPDNAWKVTRNFNPDHEETWFKQIMVKLRIFVPKSVL